MNIITYLLAKDGKLLKDGAEMQRLANAVGCSPYYLYMVALGSKKAGAGETFKKASAALCVKIERATGGQVTRAELRPDLFGPIAAQAKVQSPAESHAEVAA